MTPEPKQAIVSAEDMAALLKLAQLEEENNGCGLPVDFTDALIEWRDAILAQCAEEVRELVEAAKELSDMYTHAWDLTEGGLLMMESSIPKFEQAHTKMQSALAKFDKKQNHD